MHASEIETVELATYQLNDFVVTWYATWEDSRGSNAPLALWKEFTKAFVDHFLPTEIIEAKAIKFVAVR